MDFSNINRNDPCPCGSGKKFKRCHMGREDEILNDRLQADPGRMAQAILKLPPAQNPKAAEMVAGLTFKSAAGRDVTLKLVDLAAYTALDQVGQDSGDKGSGSVLVNPMKTRVLDPNHIYVAISPDAEASTVVHQLAHAADLVEGSGLTPGMGQALSRETGVPVELLEHSQEYGKRLLDLAGKFKVELDAEDEIVAFMAENKMLLSSKLIAKGDKEPLLAEAEKSIRFMRENAEKLNRRIKDRTGYQGQLKPPTDQG